VANQVELVSSDEIDDATAAAISEIGQSSTGALKVKLHDKRAPWSTSASISACSRNGSS
jgi:phage terminase small subunit